MAKKIIGLVLVLGLVVIGVNAFAYGHGRGAWGPGYGNHMRGGYGPGPGAYGPGYNVDPKFAEETAKLRADLYQKQVELNSVLSADTIDAEKAKGLQADIGKMRDELAQKGLDAQIEFRKNNPDAARNFGPGYGMGGRGGYGPGYGMGGRGGYGPGYGMGGRGPGYCWR